jgi:carbonic anhydrase/acetyltransferase-like protein (isoleucine patch superfamily)
MPIYKFENKIPKISKTSYIHPQAVIIGDVEIGDYCFVGPGAVIRGDFGKIRIGNQTSIQENCILHGDIGETLLIHDNVIIGHGAILHDAILYSYVLVGMNAILLNKVVCEDHVLIGAASVVKEGFHIPSNVLVAGNPAKIIKPLTTQQKKQIYQGIKNYKNLARRYKKDCSEILEPLR